MKIDVPEVSASGLDAVSPLSTTEQGSPLSHPVSTPGSPTSVSTLLSGEGVEGSAQIESAAARRQRAGRKRPRPSSTARKPRPRVSRMVSEDFTTKLGSQDTPCISSAGEEDDDSAGDGSAMAREDDIVTAVSYENIHEAVKTHKKPSDSRADSEKSSLSCSARSSSTSIPPLPNPLHHKHVHDLHVRALRLEVELSPMRQILFRLMSHVSYNRRGLFNVPVDPVALNLPDYDRIVTRPMDLGTIKAKLHALAYSCRSEVAEDIRLVFQNAILYNPREQFAHSAARKLLDMFEAAYHEVPESSNGGGPQAARLESVKDSNVAPQSSSAAAPVQLAPTSFVPTAQPAISVTSSYEAPAAASVLPLSQPQATTKPPVHTKRGVGSAACYPANLLSRRKGGAGHSCFTCLGRKCAMCNEGCIAHEPTLLVCSGSNCGGTKIRKGAVYYTSRDGTSHYCQRCYANLPAVLPQSGDQHDSFGSIMRYKRDLLKRKNDEEVVESWLTCTNCHQGVHEICAMFNEYAHSKADFVCPTCVSSSTTKAHGDVSGDKESARNADLYSFVCGSEVPVSMDDIWDKSYHGGHEVLSADKLPETPVSAFIERKVRERMVDPACPNADRTVSVRVISDCEKCYVVPEVVRKHFRMAADSSETHLTATALPPSKVRYNSVAIALFQRIDGVDVCIFCMYVQEYDGNDEHDTDNGQKATAGQDRRVYIAYLDSVEHFRPRSCRTDVYHEMLVAYLATARVRGYETAHIWACPPSRGNSFVFWNHPSSQRTPSKDRLVSWYHGALSHAVECGVVTDVSSLYERSFEEFMTGFRDDKLHRSVEQGTTRNRPGKMLCPPLLEGDFWIEEAQRIHAASIMRYLKTKSGLKDAGCNALASDEAAGRICPALQVASLLRNRIMSLPNAAPFRRPVNAAAMNLKDYHRVIKRPMDLGTVYSHCFLGEFESLRELVSDVELVFSNAKLYNPKGHIIHGMAVEVQDVFFQELNALTEQWGKAVQLDDVGEQQPSWLRYAEVSMSLDACLLGVPPKADMLASCSIEEASTPALNNTPANVNASESVEAVVSASTVDTHTTASGKIRSLQEDLFTGGPEAVLRRMLGEDDWMLDSRHTLAPKSATSKKTKSAKRPNEGHCEVSSKRKRQSWLGEEVANSMRKIRTSFFTCSLTPNPEPSEEEKRKLAEFDSYSSFYSSQSGDSSQVSSRIADARHALLEFSQYRKFEFDTMRRAKYSTAMLLYHLHNNDAPGLVPCCTSCFKTIQHVRWHKIRKAIEETVRGRNYRARPKNVHAPATPLSEELCSDCHSKRATDGNNFIPLPVSFKR